MAINGSRWANQVLIQPEKYLILDTETTGLSLRDEIIEIGILNIAGEVIFNSLIKPSIAIPPEASDIHGITDEMVQTSPTFSDIYDELVRILRHKEIIIYNANFDINMLGEACRKINRFPLELRDRSFCAMKIYSDYCVSSKWLPLHGGHRAIASIPKSQHP
jgi:DNA polymerase-3 subunit epsilon